jgi:DNA double-strand break repair helicase HerA and related ATPase
MAEPIFVAKSGKALNLLPNMSNRHGLIAGATGTGKTVTLQVLAEGFSRIGVPVFMSDVKGDLAGITQPGEANPKISKRAKDVGAKFEAHGCPAILWDVWGEQGHPVRSTISEMGPLLLGRMLNLNDTQSGVLELVFKIADDNGLLLLDMKDIRAMLQYVGENASGLTSYGHISSASVGTIQRGLLTLEQQGGDRLFGEPALELDDLLQTDSAGQGLINILVADKLMRAPKVYATLLLWLLNEMFHRLPEVGDPEKPKLVFFFDEAHLLFEDISPALQEKIEQVVRLVRSKGVGVYFVTQNPIDIPDKVLGQLGNRVQHALRAFTPRDQKAVKSAAETFRANPAFKVETVITQLAVGEALVSFLDDHGAPLPVERALVRPPNSRIGPISADERKKIIEASVVFGHYEKAVERESAYELLQKRSVVAGAQGSDQQSRASSAPESTPRIPLSTPEAPPRKGPERETLMEAVFKSAARSVASSAGRQLVRGIMGELLKGK